MNGIKLLLKDFNKIVFYLENIARVNEIFNTVDLLLQGNDLNKEL